MVRWPLWGASGSRKFLPFGFAMEASAGLAIPVTPVLGAGDLAAMPRAVCAGILIGAGIEVALFLSGILASRTLLVWMGHPAEVMLAFPNAAPRPASSCPRPFAFGGSGRVAGMAAPGGYDCPG